MSEIKVNKVTPRVACGTTQLGDSGDTITIPSGATIQNLGTSTGFGGTGVVSWETGSIKTTGFTAVTGTGYFCNTTSGGFTVTLPSSPSAGDVVGVSDYAKTFDTATLTLGRNGSNIGGSATDSFLVVEGLAVTLVYVDGTKGWIVTDSGLQSDAPPPLYVTATGGCITTCGSYKTHTFLSPNTFCVSCAGNCGGSSTVEYMVVAGGGGGSSDWGGGSGGGGWRSYTALTPALPINGPAALSISATPYAIVVGGGGTGGAPNALGTPGNLSSFSTIESAGGGRSGNEGNNSVGDSGGSGGGGGTAGGPGCGCGGAGNTPTVSPAQGEGGGNNQNNSTGYTAGGGGAGGAGEGNSPVPCNSAKPGGAGGVGGYVPDAFIKTSCAPTYGTSGPVPSVRYFAGGGGGAAGSSPRVGGVGGSGGGGTGGVAGCQGVSGAINTGGGGGGGSGNESPNPGSGGGSGIVMIRYQYQT